MEQLLNDGLLEDGCLYACLDLAIYGQPESSFISRLPDTAPANFMSSFNFSPLLEDSDLSDIELQCESETFPAHKAVLAVHSAVFKAMFTSGMSEVSSGVINVTDVTPTALATIIRYMYTGKVDDELESDLLLQIVHGSEKYGLSGLKNYCFRRLAANITDENIGDITVAAHFYGAEESIKMTLKNYFQP